MQDAAQTLDANRSPSAAWLRAMLRLADAPIIDPRSEAAAIFLLVPAMLSVALWNGFPIIYYDTGAYLLEGLGRVFLPERSPVYSLLMDYSGARASLWLVAIFQAVVTAFVFVETVRAVSPQRSIAAVFMLGAGLVVFTGLPWYVGQIEPDCFAATAILSLYLLALRHRAIAGWREYSLLAIASLSIAVHPSHFLLAVALVIAMLVYRLVLQVSRNRVLPNARVARPLVSCVAGLGLIVAANHQLTGKIFFSRAGPAFIFARLLQDGIVMRLLDDTCPQSHYRLCAYKDNLPRTADQWLWNTNSPFYAMNKFTGTSAESSRIIRDSLRRYPLRQLNAALGDTGRQLAMFKTGDQIEPQQWVLSAPLKQFIPHQMDSYLGARQQKGEFDFRPVNWIDVSVGWFSLLGLIAAFGLAIRLRRAEAGLLSSYVLVALLFNAAICATFSNPHNRYQSRVIWLAPFALLLIAGDRRNFALRGVAESGT